MNYYFAPMEGITGYIYRNAHNKVFGGIDKYFSPFISPIAKKDLKTKERNDILPEHNESLHLVPQILTNSAKDFVRIGKILANDYEYEEINLNLGCPVRTVVSKKKGSGFLAYPEKIDEFLDIVYNELPNLKLSIKTRLGMTDEEEFDELLEIYNKYPLSELIIHARIQADYYKYTPRLHAFKKAAGMTNHKLCYNGDLCSLEDIEAFHKEFPMVDTVMIGRGLLTNPALLQGTLTKENLLTFHNEIYTSYREVLSGDTPVLYKMKELWCYMGALVPDDKKELKQIKKLID
ncbi:dihydrouridine synthase family protein [Lachnospiraceae bacterium TWA4]|nr:dihydrouridine synthase family protein [Lachnospiraceae bacterium TWA4]